MKQEDILHRLSALPPEAQLQVIDFIAFLQTRYPGSPASKAVKTPRLSSETFIGIWRDREDLENSSGWVRNIREREWVKRRA